MRGSEFTGLHGIAKDNKFEELMHQNHTVMREGKCYSEFSTRVKSFPHRDHYPTMSKQTVDLLVNQGGSIHLDLDGYSLQKSFELRLDEIVGVELWMERTDSNVFNDDITFSRKVRSVDALTSPLAEQLSMVEGDSATTFEVMFKYYKAKSHVLQGQVKKLSDGGSITSNKTNNKTPEELHWVALKNQKRA